MNIAEEYRIALVKKATKAELSFRVFLLENHIEHEFQKIIYYGNLKFFIVDFWFPNNLIVEIDGKYHSDKEQKAKDKERSSVLAKMGYKVRRATNKMILTPLMFDKFKKRFLKNLTYENSKISRK